MWKNNLIIAVPLSIISFLLGIISGVIVSRWDLLQGSFFQIRLVEVAQIIVALTVAVFITYLIGRKTSMEVRRHEILVNIIDKLQDRLTNAFDLGLDYMRTPSQDKVQNVLGSLKNVTMLAQVVIEIHGRMNPSGSLTFGDKMKTALFELKRALTDTPFGRVGHVQYSQEVIAEYYLSYQSIQKDLYNLKVDIYS